MPINKEQSTYIYSILGLLFVIFITFLITRSSNRRENKKVELASFNQGIFEGKEIGVHETKKALQAAVLGAKMIFTDESFMNSLNTQQIVHQLNNSQGPKIKTLITDYSDKYCKSLSRRLIKYGDFSAQETEILTSKIESSKAHISLEMYNDYLTELQTLSHNPDLEKKAETFANRVPEITCAVVDLMDPAQKLKIAQKIIKSGTRRLKGQFKKTVGHISEYAINSITEQLCVILMNHSRESISDAIYDYALAASFTEKNMIGQNDLESVLELVSAKSKMKLSVPEKFARLGGWSSANYIFSADATVIAGIDLNKFYCVEFIPKEMTTSRKTEILVTLPKPELLSIYTEISPYSINKTWFTSLESHEIKAGYNNIKQQARDSSISTGILLRAEEGAYRAISNLFKPLMLNSSRDYLIKVNFANQAPGEEQFVLKG